MKKRLPNNVVDLYKMTQIIYEIYIFSMDIIKKYDNMWRPGVSLQHSRISKHLYVLIRTRSSTQK